MIGSQRVTLVHGQRYDFFRPSRRKIVSEYAQRLEPPLTMVSLNYFPSLYFLQHPRLIFCSFPIMPSSETLESKNWPTCLNKLDRNESEFFTLDLSYYILVSSASL